MCCLWCLLSNMNEKVMEDPLLWMLSIVMSVVLGGALLIWVQRSCRVYSYGASLPKGSLGWPVIGESLAFLPDPTAFSNYRLKRYGSLFKTCLFSRLMIVGTTPEFAKFVASNSKLFRPAFPKHIAAILGPKSFMLKDGPSHMSVRNLVLKGLRADALRTQVHDFETIILENLVSWEKTGTVIALDATQKLTWDTSNWVLFRDRQSTRTPEGRENFGHIKQIMRATVSLPVNLPGTAYAKGMKAKKVLSAYYKNLMKRAKDEKSTAGAFLDALVAARDDPEGRAALKQLDDDTIADTIFLLNFAAYDTTSTTLLWILKILVDHPDVLLRIQAEQQEILKTKDLSLKGPRLTWEDTRKMVYTNKFLQELLRYVNVVPMVVREAIQDCKFEGHLIPKGWTILTMMTSMHSDPDIFPDLSFNPDRFDVTMKPYTYLPFFAGSHMCPGTEIAKLISFIYIHHLTTTYIYERIGPDKGIETEGILPKLRGGYPIKVRQRS